MVKCRVWKHELCRYHLAIEHMLLHMLLVYASMESCQEPSRVPSQPTIILILKSIALVAFTCWHLLWLLFDDERILFLWCCRWPTTAADFNFESCTFDERAEFDGGNACYNSSNFTRKWMDIMRTLKNRRKRDISIRV